MVDHATAPDDAVTGMQAANAAVWPAAQRVTVVIISHNYGSFLGLAIDSALGQDYEALEIVVVDDGSTDNSRDIIVSYGDRVRRLFKPQGGHVSAFNDGFAASRGDIVIFLDADDLLYPHYVSTIVRAWEPTLAKIQCRLDTIDQDGVSQDMPFPYFAADLTPEAVLDQALSHGVYPWTVSTGNAYARAFLARLLPIVADRAISPDGYVNKLAPLYGRIKSLNLVLGAYRVHGRNTWAQTGRTVQLKGITRSVWLDAWNHQQFEAHARRFGYQVVAYDRINVPQQLENRLISLRLAPERHAFPGDKRLAIAGRGIGGAWRAPGLSLVGRVAWSFWFIVLAVAPKRLIYTVFQLGRAQLSRNRLARVLVRLSRGLSGARRSAR